jgi:hypothetical protein
MQKNIRQLKSGFLLIRLQYGGILYPFLALCMIWSSSVSAQHIPDDSLKNAVTIDPIDLIWKLHVQYERMLTPEVSAGAGFHYYYYDGVDSYKGEIFSRFYYAPGFFLQPSLSGYRDSYFKKYTGGISFSWGSRRIFRNIHIVLDASVGLQFSPYYFSPQKDPYGYASWFTSGAGSLLLARMAVGYAL